MATVTWTCRVLLSADPDEVVAWMRGFRPRGLAAGATPRLDEAARALTVEGGPQGHREEWRTRSAEPGGAWVEVDGRVEAPGLAALWPAGLRARAEADVHAHLAELQRRLGVTAAKASVRVAVAR